MNKRVVLSPLWLASRAKWALLPVLVLPVWAVLPLAAHAQDSRIYRCGNVYTNTVTPEQAKTCTYITGTNVVEVPAAKPIPTARAARPERAAPLALAGVDSSAMPRVSAAEQRAKDTDARAILEAELRKAEARQVELEKDYNNGQPEKTPADARSPQKYQERVAALKATMARNQNDIASIKRELGRLTVAAAK